MTYDIVFFTDMSNSFWHAKTAGAYRLATELRKHGYSVKVVDFFGKWLCNAAEFQKLIDLLVGENTLFIGFSGVFYSPVTKTEQIKSWYNIKEQELSTWPLPDSKMNLHFTFIRKKYPNVKLVYGGVGEARLIPKILLSQMDFVVRGLADNTVVELANHLHKATPLKFMPSTDRAKLIEHDMRAAAFDFSSSQIKYQETDHVMPGEVLPLELSRGCLFKCAFCEYPLIGRKKNDPEYHKDVNTMADEFRCNFETFGVNKYFFTDETFNESTHKIEDIIRARDLSGVNINFMAFLRVDLLGRYPEQMALLNELGMQSCFLGIESLHRPSAQAIGKSTHPEKIKDTIHKLKEICVDSTVHAGFIAGLPHDTPDNLDKWTGWLLTDDSPIDGFRMMPLYINVGGTSIISRDPTSYGYELTGEVDNPWRNSVWDFKQARQYCRTFMQKAWESSKLYLSGFDYLGIQNMNLPQDKLNTIISTPLNQIDYTELAEKTEIQWQNYKQKLLNYEDTRLKY